ncbi:MAG: OmpA family protein, partial [Gammaproteobacteria bacterium]|nr:OmpA family protein [Gammaproteobacteria bacterium]
MKNRKHLIASLIIAFTLAGCAGEEAVKPTTEEKAPAPAQTAPAADKAGTTGASLSDREKQRRAELLAQRRVYFAFDSSTIDDEARAIIEAHSAHLVANTQLKVTLEGNCDERGTREYNLALGERRAQAVEKMMKVLGVAGNRIKTVSYG